MMNYYQELSLLPHDEISIHFLWSKVFQQIHLGLVEMQDDRGQVRIGISFPEYFIGEKYNLLGGKFRLFAQDEATLTRFDAAKWLSRLSDYVHCTGIRPVPEKLKGYATYQREQPKTNKERLARRYARRHSVDFNATLLHYNEMMHKSVKSPFIRLKSLSSNHSFCLWINKKVVSEAAGHTFSSYGLSAIGTVPEF